MLRGEHRSLSPLGMVHPVHPWTLQVPGGDGPEHHGGRCQRRLRRKIRRAGKVGMSPRVTPSAGRQADLAIPGTFTNVRFLRAPRYVAVRMVTFRST